MARPIKKGLDYFPLDVNIDDSIELIEAEHGLEGFAIVIKLWQKIYSDGYYIIWDKDKSLLFCRKINSELNTVNSVINSCLERDLFDKNIFETYNILTSSGIQKRFISISSQLKRKSIILITELILVNSEFTQFITEFISINSEFSTQRKGKEIKGKESKGEAPQIFESSILDYEILKEKLTGEIYLDGICSSRKFDLILFKEFTEQWLLDRKDTNNLNYNVDKLKLWIIEDFRKQKSYKSNQQKSTSQKIDEAVANITLD